MKAFIKWIENFWYHYKFRTIVVLFAAAIAVFTVVQILTREVYDYNVILYMSEDSSYAFNESVRKTIEQNGEDLDENGKVSVNLINLSYDPASSDLQNKNSQSATLQGELASGRSYLFLTDDQRFYELSDMGAFESLDFLKDMDQKACAIKETPFEKQIIRFLADDGLTNINIPPLYVSLRKFPQNPPKQAIDAKQLLHNIITKNLQ